MFPGLLHDLGLSAFKEERFMMKLSALSDEARARYLFRFHDRLRAIVQ